jgi:hypothetical protein
MKALLSGAYVPITFSVGFIEQRIDVVQAVFEEWTRRNYRVVETFPVAGDLSQALSQLQPLTVPPRRELLLSTDSQWTAYFDNGTNGPDPRTPVVYLTQQLRCRGLIATNVPHTLTTETRGVRGTYGCVAFELFASAPREFLNYERSISAANDGGQWRFDANGVVQPFEEVDQYSVRRIADRFTPDMLERYCESLGVRLNEDGFYSGSGRLVVIRDPLPRGCEEVTLAEAQCRITPAT